RRSERLEGRSRSKAKPRGERARSRGKRSERMKAKLLRNVKVYEVSKDPEDHLGIFSTAAEQEEWHMPVWRRMFRQALSGAARNWFDDLDPKSVDSFEELSQKFLEEFSQQNRYVKDPTEIHGIKRRMNEGLQAFMARFKSESWHIKGVPSVMRISAFMHGHGHPKFSKKLNDKIPKIVDEMFKRVRAFIKGEAATRSAEVARASQWDKGASRPGWSGGVNFPLPPPLIGTLEKQNLNKFCDYHGDKGHNTNDCFHLKKQIEEAVASRKLAHLVKDIRRGNQRNESQGRGGMKVINMTPPIILEGAIEGYHIRRIYVDGGSSSEIMYEHCFKSFGVDVKSKLRKASASLVGFSSETYHPLGLIDLMVTIGEPGKSKTLLLKFSIVKCRSPYNVIIGRTKMRSLGAVGSTIHSMITFPTGKGVATMRTSKEAIWECKQIERMQKVGEGAYDYRRNLGRDTLKEKVTIHDDRPDQHVLINGKLSIECKQKLEETLRRNADVFAWTTTVNMVVPRFVMEHQLQAYPLAELVVHKNRLLTPDRRKVLREKVFEWLKEGIIRRVQYPRWVANAIPIKQRNGTWQMQMDYTSLNKVYAKDIYPFPEIEEELESLMGYQYKCFLRLSKEHSQVRMSKNDEEKTCFHTEEGIYCFTHMPKGLKNSAATLQRMMDKVLGGQKGRNMEVYLEVVVKSKTEKSLIEDVEETLHKLRRVNIKIDPSKCTFGMEEGDFLGYVVTTKGIKVDPKKVKAILQGPMPRDPDEIQSLSLQLTNISIFIPNMAEFGYGESI
ncbi:reverse transcriptase domain-containing protein, partial [Tanacetum coccineum]